MLLSLALRLFHLGCFLFEAGEEAVEAAGLAGLLAEAFAEAAEPDVAAEVVGHPVERVMNLGINKETFSTKKL